MQHMAIVGRIPCPYARSRPLPGLLLALRLAIQPHQCRLARVQQCRLAHFAPCPAGPMDRASFIPALASVRGRGDALSWLRTHRFARKPQMPLRMGALRTRPVTDILW